MATDTPPSKVAKLASPAPRDTASPARPVRIFGKELTNSPVNSPQSTRQVAKKAPRTGGRLACFTTPTAAADNARRGYEDESPTRTMERVQRTNEALAQKLSQRRKRDLDARETLAMKLNYVKKEQHRLTRKLNRSQLELVTRTNVAQSMLANVPGAHLDELEQKNRQIIVLEEELQSTKGKLELYEAGLAKLAGASDSYDTEDLDTARLAELLAAEMKADKANAKVLGTVAEELLAANGEYRSRCRAAEGQAAALSVLNKAKLEHEQQQEKRIRNLEAELENVRGHSWQHLEQLEQLEQAMQEAHGQLSRQSKELATKAQEIELLERRVEAAEEYLEATETELAELKRVGCRPSGRPSLDSY